MAQYCELFVLLRIFCFILLVKFYKLTRDGDIGEHLTYLLFFSSRFWFFLPNYRLIRNQSQCDNNVNLVIWKIILLILNKNNFLIVSMLLFENVKPNFL